jgi:hypothetical protein
MFCAYLHFTVTQYFLRYIRVDLQATRKKVNSSKNNKNYVLQELLYIFIEFFRVWLMKAFPCGNTTHPLSRQRYNLHIL